MDSALHSPRQTEELLQRLTKSNKHDQFVQDFSQCQSEADRVACLYKLPEIEGLFSVQEKFKCKDKKDAEICRAEGNKYFKGKNYQRALEFYTLSILKAPHDSENVSLAYNNRSLTNFYLKQYVSCLQDIELAFLHNYPKKSCYKLYQRLGRCMYHLRHKDKAVKAFQQTIVTLECADIDAETKCEMVEDMNRAISQCDAITGQPVSISIKNVNLCHEDIPKLSSDVSNEVPCLSDSVEIKLDSYGGRGLYATTDVSIGDILIVEQPFSSVLLKEYNISHCHYCCNRLFLTIPCFECSSVAFCSLDCRKTAWEKFHWAECRILGNIQDSKGDLGLLATRMILSAGYDALVSIQAISEELSRSKGFSPNGQYRSDTYSACYSLVHHYDKRTFKDLLTRTVSTLFFLKHLELVGFFSASKRNEAAHKYCQISSANENVSTSSQNIDSSICTVEKDVVLSDDVLLNHKCIIGGHILRNIMMLPCNAHEVSELDLNAEQPAMSVTKELAAAIYPVLSLINHSCDPSIVRHSFGNVCIARAIRSIKAGEELKDNYGALYPTMDLTTRQSNMKSQYFFTCSCEACEGDWPLYFNIPCEHPLLRCSSCNGRVLLPNIDNSTECVKCDVCGANEDISMSVLKIGQLEASYKSTLMSVIDGDISSKNFNSLLLYLQLVEKTIQRPWRDINDCQEALKQCLSMQANCFALSSSS